MFGSIRSPNKKKNIFDSGDLDEEKYELEKDEIMEKESTTDSIEKIETITQSPRTFESFSQEEREVSFDIYG